MTKETNEKTPGSAGSASSAKRPYQKPAFRHERVFETMALSCGKVNVTQQQCKSINKSS